jgi:hypothetical protein
VQGAFESFAQMIECQQPALWAGADSRRRLDAFGRVLARSAPSGTAFIQEPLPPTNSRAMRRAGWRRPRAGGPPYRP